MEPYDCYYSLSINRMLSWSQILFFCKNNQAMCLHLRCYIWLETSFKQQSGLFQIQFILDSAHSLITDLILRPKLKD